MKDLDDDETSDKTWNAKANGFTSSKADSASIGSRAHKIRIMPLRCASSKIKFQDVTDEETDEDDISEANQTPAINRQVEMGFKKVVFFSV